MFVVEQTQAQLEQTNKRIKDEKALPLEQTLKEVEEFEIAASQARLTIKFDPSQKDAVNAQMQLRARLIGDRLKYFGGQHFDYYSFYSIKLVTEIWPEDSEKLRSPADFDTALDNVMEATKLSASKLKAQLNALQKQTDRTIG